MNENEKDSWDADIIQPTAEEVSEGYKTLQACWPMWSQTPALLVTSEDDFGVIALAVSYDHDDLGFKLQFAIQEKLLAPADFSDDVYAISFAWNQPYLSLSPESIFAPYAYYIEFDHAGVERARELSKVLREHLGELPGSRLLRRCFGPRGAEYSAEMMSQFTE